MWRAFRDGGCPSPCSPGQSSSRVPSVFWWVVRHRRFCRICLRPAPTRLVRAGGSQAPAENVFALPSGISMEMVDLQTNMELKARLRYRDFRGLVSREVSSALRMSSESVCLPRIHLPLWNYIFTDGKKKKSNQRAGAALLRHLKDCLHPGP